MSQICQRATVGLSSFSIPPIGARTSYFERLARDDPAELESGLARLADDLGNGRRPNVEVEPLRRQVGDGAVLAWRQPLSS